jgi:hypothetical protein
MKTFFRYFFGLKLQPKLLLVVGFLFAGSLAFFLISRGVARKNLAILNETNQVTFPILESSDKTIFLMERLRDSLVAAVSSSEPDELGSVDKIAHEIRTLLILIQTNYTEVQTDATSKITIALLKDRFETWYQSARSLSFEVATGKLALGDAVDSITKMKEQNLEYQDFLRKFRQKSHEQFLSTIEESHDQTEKSLQVGIYFLLFSLLIYSLVFLFLTSSRHLNIPYVMF